MHRLYHTPGATAEQPNLGMWQAECGAGVPPVIAGRASSAPHHTR